MSLDLYEADELGCCCDFVEIVEDHGDRFELHHVIPDDGSPHQTTLQCPCAPDIELVEELLIVVDHRDQDPAEPLED